MRRFAGPGKARFTLLELLVAVFLMAILFPLIAETCRLANQSIADLSDRAGALTQAELAVDALACDFGRAANASVTNGELRLTVWRDLPSEGHRQVGYLLDAQSRLVRSDSRTGTNTVVATGATLFAPLAIDPDTVRIELRFARGGTTRDLVVIGCTQ
jgi:type II secretory pathway pseudopilin PulG